ncbi:hypothetical protein Bca52824_056917 [Brassica carinata]|uniref:C2 NT-type domain-containing protein n=1 Tax=Brassica carinata TaxID=52824 RepID=A0A8X7QR94_BRACI|nr:hypothetical protein Bca52824_056917 [Brassica carinata]
MSKANSEESSSSRKLLKEVETLNESLYVNKNPRRPVVGPNNTSTKPLARTNLTEPQKEKKSIWNWPLRALSHVRNRRFNCCFSAQIHSIDNLPPTFQDLHLTVHWKRRDESLTTRPAKVLNGRAEFKDKMTHTCSVYGSRSGQHHSAKYEAKHFLLYAALVGSPDVDLGKHRMDLTSLLPLTLEELQDEKSSGKWSTTFQLTGKASGATLSVSFGYTVVGDTRSASNAKQGSSNAALTRAISGKSSLGSGKSVSKRYDHGVVGKESRPLSKNVVEIKDLHEVVPVAAQSDLVSSVNALYKKFDEEKVDAAAAESQFESDVVIKHIEPDESNEDSNAHQVEERVANMNESDVPLEDVKKAEEDPSTFEKVGTEDLPPEEPCVDRDETDVLSQDIKKAAEDPTTESEKVGTEDLSPEDPLVHKKETDVSLEEPKIAGEVPITRSEEVVEISRENLPSEERSNVSPKEEKGIVSGDDEDDMNGGRDVKEIIMEDLESALKNVEMLEATASEEEEDQENHGRSTPNKEAASIDVADSVAKESLLSEEESNVSPKEEESIVSRDDEDVVNGERDGKETIMKDLESALESVEMLEATASEDEEDHGGSSTPNKEEAASTSIDVADSVANEFLDMLGIEHSPFGLTSESEPESPRERLLREFEMETLADSSLFDFGIESDVDPQTEGDENYESDFDLASLVHDIEEEYQIETQARVSSNPRAKMLEDLETETLHLTMRSHFPPADFPVNEAFDLPPLGDGLGPVVQTKNGGFVRSMNPLLFRNSKAGGSLIMQVSSPVVVPAEMGSGIMEILQRLATAGIEKLSMQANKVMPLDDITGKTMEEVVWETSPAVDSGHRDHVPPQRDTAAKPKKFGSSTCNNNLRSEYVSLEDLAPLAMDQIEALSLEGLRIQSGMSDEDAPSDISAQSIGEISAFQGLEGAAGLQLLNIKDDGDGDDDDGLMSLSLTLDEWMKLDSGDIGDKEEINEKTSKILAAHHANPLNFIRKGEKRKGKKGRKCGLLGNNFTVALMVQLRDPLRNYEPVGAPMLSLIQVERLFVPPKPIIYSTVSELRRTDEEGEEAEAVKEEKTMLEEQGIPQYKISEVHLTGMKSETDKKPWGVTTQNQQVQSGSRWLMANGMGKGNNTKVPLMKPKAGDKLWSVSGSGSKWKELGKMGKLSAHKRNPNVIMPK